MTFLFFFSLPLRLYSPVQQSQLQKNKKHRKGHVIPKIEEEEEEEETKNDENGNEYTPKLRRIEPNKIKKKTNKKQK